MPTSVSASMQYAGSVTLPLPDIPVGFSCVYAIASPFKRLSWRQSARLDVDQDHSGVIPASFTTCAHFSISAGMKRANSSGVLVQGVIASAFILSWVSGRSMKAMSSALSLSMIGFGLNDTATTENQGRAA